MCCREAPGVTCLYTALLALIFFLEVVLGLAAYHTKDKVRLYPERKTMNKRIAVPSSVNE